MIQTEKNTHDLLQSHTPIALFRIPFLQFLVACGIIQNSLSGFKPVKHMVFSGLYPADGSDFEALSHAIEKLTCNDASVSVTKETSNALGMGFRYHCTRFPTCELVRFCCFHYTEYGTCCNLFFYVCFTDVASQDCYTWMCSINGLSKYSFFA